MKQPTSKSFDRTSSPDEVKNKLPMEAPRDKQRLVISIIGWIIDLIINAIRKNKEKQNR